MVAALERGGFRVSRVRGSHYFLRKTGGTAPVVVPVHGSQIVPVGTLRSVLRQAGLTVSEFSDLLRQ